MRAYFEQLATGVCTLPAGLDRTSLYFSAEDSDFIRFNKAQVRQATHVMQRYGTVSVVAGARRASSTCALSGHAESDLKLLLAEREQLALQLPLVPEDPFLLLPDTVHSTERAATGSLPTPAQLIAEVTRLAAGTDLVGFYAGGPMVRGYADSRGQRNWHAVDSFHFEWCLYREADLAVKSSYAGAVFSPRELAARMDRARAQLEVLGRPRKSLAPGAYRVCFSPVAVADLLATLSWGGFGERAARTGVSTLVQLQRGLQQFHPSVRLTEDIANGLAPAFQDDGFVKPAQVPLVADGRMAGTLVSPRSAREYGVASNGNAEEGPEALAMAPGSLPAVDALQALGTGVYLSDLHYLNYSDRQACRMTGMTRFACLWVEDGVPVAPIPVMRFDDSLLRMFGAGLVALTDQAELVPDNATYGSRQLRSVSAPGAVVNDFVFTL